MEESWRGADHTQTSWGAADRCHESTAVIGTARMEGGEAGMEERKEWERKGKVEDATLTEENVMKKCENA